MKRHLFTICWGFVQIFCGLLAILTLGFFDHWRAQVFIYLANLVLGKRDGVSIV